MPVAIPIIAAGIGAAGSIVSSKMQQGAAKEATQQQTRAGTEALGLQRDIYNQQVQGMSPYTNVGAQSVNTLGGLMGFPSAPQGGAGLPVRGQPAAPAPPAGPQPSVFAGGRAHIDEVKAALDRDKSGQITLGDLFPHPQTQARQQTASSYGPVRMRAPDGSEENVLPEEVEMFRKAGAVVV